MTTRRTFVSALGAAVTAAVAPDCLWADGRRPDLRLGLISDVHVFADDRSAQKTIRALTYLRRQNVDAVCVSGDIAHAGMTDQLACFVRAWESVFPHDRYPDGRPVGKVFLYGNHDVAAKAPAWMKVPPDVFAAQSIRARPAAVWRAFFHEDFAPVSIKRIRGYAFVFGHWLTGPRVREAPAFLRAHADELRGDRPFFYLQHARLGGTVNNNLGRDEELDPVARVLAEFPNAVAITGHTHKSLTDELSVWQGAFTAVNAACVIHTGYRYANPAFANGDNPEGLYGRRLADQVTPLADTYPDGSQGLVLDVYPDRLVFHRRSFSLDVANGADWELPFPAPGAGGPFDPAVRAAAATPPAFAADAALTVVRGQRPTRGKKLVETVTVSFPNAIGRGPGGRAFAYEVTAADPAGTKPAVRQSVLASDYHLPPTALRERSEIVFRTEDLPAGENSVFSVRPFDSFHRCGEALVRRAAAPETPLFRAGIMTDTHVLRTVESCALVRRAMELFRDRRVDMVIHNGDIADRFYPEAYRNVRRIFDETKTDGFRPEEVWTYAWHDSFEFKPGVPRADTEKHSAEAFEVVRRLLKDPRGHTAQFTFRGFPFLVFPQHVGFPGFIGFAEYEAIVRRTCAEHPGRPVFVIDHPPPRGTVYGSRHVGDGEARRRILNRYPQVVALTGHTHGSLSSDLLIWQREFTVVNAGCLQVWRGALGGAVPVPKRSYGALTMDVFADRLVFRRWDVRDGTEIGADRPWIVPLPFASAAAPWERSRCRDGERVSDFVPGACVAALRKTTARERGVEVSFATAAVGPLPMRYRIEAQARERGAWKSFAWSEAFSEFYLRPRDRVGRVRLLFPESRLPRGESVRFAVIPVGQYGGRGCPILSEPVEVPDNPAWKTVFETRSPETDLAYVGAKSRKPVPRDDGGFHVGAGHAGSRLLLPEEAFRGLSPAHFRVIVDMRTVQPENAWLWRLRIVESASGAEASAVQTTSADDSGAQRWAFDLTRKDGVSAYELAFTYGDTSRVRFERVRIEREETP